MAEVVGLAAFVVDLGLSARGAERVLCRFQRVRVAELLRELVDLDDAVSGERVDLGGVVAECDGKALIADLGGSADSCGCGAEEAGRFRWVPVEQRPERVYVGRGKAVDELRSE